MKSIFLVFTLLCLNPLFSQEKTETVSLDPIIALINNSLGEAQKDLDASNLKIEEARIGLKTLYDKSGNGGFKLLIKASKNIELQNATEFNYVYKNIEKDNSKSIKFDNNNYKSFERNLTKAITTAAREFKNSTRSVEGLEKDGFSIKLSFSVTKATTAGVEFEVLGIGIDASGEYQNTAIHTIGLTFKIK